MAQRGKLISYSIMAWGLHVTVFEWELARVLELNVKIVVFVEMSDQ